MYAQLILHQTSMNVLKEIISVHTIVTTLLETIPVVVGLAIGYLPIVTPALVSHYNTISKTLVSHVYTVHTQGEYIIMMA